MEIVSRVESAGKVTVSEHESCPREGRVSKAEQS